MFSARRNVSLWVLMVLAGLTRVEAQEFRVYTRVFNDQSVDAGPRGSNASKVIARSVSLFHAGKVYDYIDGIGEVTIFEPARRRFTVIDGSGQTATVVTFDELNHLVKLAEREAERQAAELAQDGGREATSEGAFLLSLVTPDFEQQFDRSSNRLSLTSSYCSYTVQCDAQVRPEYVESYLRYADWTARLNAVLHPGALLPQPRIMLDAALRDHQAMPVQVTLTLKTLNEPRTLRLRAEHTIHWDLDSKDRSNIHHWESLLRNQSVHFVTIQEYQRTMLISHRANR